MIPGSLANDVVEISWFYFLALFFAEKYFVILLSASGRIFVRPQGFFIDEKGVLRFLNIFA